ncbi:biotin synthase [Verrucomicrobium sp. GAS474]|uniref:radical SAM protein n=1 Tax=Verrucomicrobium sp. GAS474 TaxID=1882831 RepID=UPI00087A7750|nr:radical SAM protein [Verrucomicrobium sp. GAS474]SDU05116.1 biotin synthase [Verrucomicrobium sp. GAS474]
MDETPEMLRRIDARGEAQAAWHARGAALRDEVFGREVFVRAVVEISNYCRQNCSYCGMRRDNRELSRYRMERETLREVIFDGLPASVTDINFQTGEDPVAVREILIPLIDEVRRTTTLGISVCLGILEEKLYRELYDAGARFYIIKLETGNEAHYREVQAPGTFQSRLDAIERLAAGGWRVSSGFIHGLPGQTRERLGETLRRLADLPLVGNSVSPFIPGAETPTGGHPAADLEETLNLVTAMRLMSPRRIIPAVSAMGILEARGYERALRAGANLATINLTPDASRDRYRLYTKDRVIMSEQRVLSAIAAAGLEPSRKGILSVAIAAAAEAPAAVAP